MFVVRSVVVALGCASVLACGDATVVASYPGDEDVLGTTLQEVSCPPRMSRFPVGAPHNIGYDAASCGTGTCRTSCPDRNANSDWNPAATHNGIDVFAFQRAPLVAVADGTIVAVGTPSSSSGLRVRLRDACGWEYYYGHLDQAVVSVGQRVTAGQLIGYMGRTGTRSTHLHFNVSPDGQYLRDINPFELLRNTSGTACAAPPPPPPPPGPAPTPSCGHLASGGVLLANQMVVSCDGRFLFVMQGDGNLVLYQQGRGALWSSRTNGSGAKAAILQGDGNLVLYADNWRAVWSTNTANRPGATLAVQNDGNVVLYQGGVARWHTHTCCR
ncbi:MAG: peptidoglycan DD-metalloendopeptidase family protein [Myxococcota bacterium]